MKAKMYIFIFYFSSSSSSPSWVVEKVAESLLNTENHDKKIESHKFNFDIQLGRINQ